MNRLPLRYAAPLMAAGIFLVLCASPSRAATPEQVDNAIKKAVTYLYSQQKPGGHWETDSKRVGQAHNWEQQQGDSFGGFTALCTYALLAAGETPQDEKMAHAISFLKTADVIGVYSLGLRMQVWHLIPQTPEIQALMKKDAAALLFNLNKEKQNRGFWDYGTGKGGRLDHSVSQYGILGLWAAEQSNIEVENRWWLLFDQVWRAQQDPGGGWSYDGNGHDAKKITPSMTAAGVATLFITQDYTRGSEGATPRGNITNPNITAGLAWMSAHFNEVGYNPYAQYGVQRIGVASGYKYFGTADWFAEGADLLVKRQKPDGQFDKSGIGGTEITCTAFATLFLTRGRAPVMMNKLQYDTVKAGKTVEGNWDERPRDVANVTRWVGRQIEQDLNWQIVNLKVPADELHDSPILYISGNQELDLGLPELDKLKSFVQAGGVILANSDGGPSPFAPSLLKLGTKLFPQYKFEELPPSHPIFTNELYHFKKAKPKLMSLSNGVREMMVLLPELDPARAWQTNATAMKKEEFELGADIFLYAVDKKNLREKGVTYIVRPDDKIKPTRTAKLARLQVGSNWDPEPEGWQRLAAILHNQFKVDLKVDPAKLDAASLAGCKVAHLTGTTSFKLDDAQKKDLQDFVQKGGTLIVDAAGGSIDFADAAQAQLKELFGDDAARGLADPLPPESPVYNLPDAKIGEVKYREFARKMLGKLKTPRINGIAIKGRLAVFFSREDLSGGLVGEQIDGINGYDPASATDLMRNLVLYGAFGPPPAPASQPGATTKAAAPAK